MNIHSIRQVILDTETTGMNKFGLHYEGHRIIEIGAVEIINRRLTNNQFHVYLNPNRSVDSDAFKIHGISNQFLIDKPVFSDIVNEFLKFIRDSELIIHNAPFDLGFLNNELKNTNLNFKTIESYCCTVIDSLKVARKMFPGQRNSLDALCERYSVNNKRVLHNALIDAQLLAHVFLFMTGGQTTIQFEETTNINKLPHIKGSMMFLEKTESKNINKKKSLKIIYANAMEQEEHNKYLDLIEKSSQGCLWKQFSKKNSSE